MQKISYRVVKWTLLVGFASSLATACVVTSGDGSDLSFGGDGNDTTDGGEPNSTGGTTSTAGTAGSGGSATTAGTGGTSTAAGTTSTGGEGGGTATYVPGQCMSENPTSATLPSCNDAPADENECRKCLRTKHCEEWQTCRGEDPKTACNFGPVEGDGGQFGCILNCFFENKDMETDPDKLLESCVPGCALQCDTDDGGLIMDTTNALVDVAYKDCNTECFPFE